MAKNASVKVCKGLPIFTVGAVPGPKQPCQGGHATNYVRRALPSAREAAASVAAALVGGSKLVMARSRLYRSQLLQVKIRLKAFAEIYTMHSFALL